MTVCCSGGHALRRLQHADRVWAKTKIRYSSFVGICPSATKVMWQPAFISLFDYEWNNSKGPEQLLMNLSENAFNGTRNRWLHFVMTRSYCHVLLWWNVITILIYSGWRHFSVSGAVTHLSLSQSQDTARPMPCLLLVFLKGGSIVLKLFFFFFFVKGKCTGLAVFYSKKWCQAWSAFLRVDDVYDLITQSSNTQYR